MDNNSVIVYLDDNQKKQFDDIWCKLEETTNSEFTGNEVWTHILANTSLYINEDVLNKTKDETKYDLELTDMEFERLRLICHRLGTYIYPKGLEYCLKNYAYKERKNRRDSLYRHILNNSNSLVDLIKEKDNDLDEFKDTYISFLSDFCKIVEYEFDIDIFSECLKVLDNVLETDKNSFYHMFWKFYETNKYFGNEIDDFDIMMRTNAIVVTNEALKSKYGLLLSLNKMDMINSLLVNEIWEY